MSSWIDAKETPPPEGEDIDVWQAWVNSETGQVMGRRLTNAWVFRGDVLHGNPTIRVQYYTHWMSVPEAPK